MTFRAVAFGLTRLVALIATVDSFAPLLTVSSPVWSIEAYDPPEAISHVTPVSVVPEGMYPTLYCAVLSMSATLDRPLISIPVGRISVMLFVILTSPRKRSHLPLYVTA